VEDIEEEALASANSCVTDVLRVGESAEAYALRQVQHQAFIEACRVVCAIPSNIVEKDDDEQEKASKERSSDGRH